MSPRAVKSRSRAERRGKMARRDGGSRRVARTHGSYRAAWRRLGGASRRVCAGGGAVDTENERVRCGHEPEIHAGRSREPRTRRGRFQVENRRFQVRPQFYRGRFQVENRRFHDPNFAAEDFRLKIEDCRFDPEFYRGRFQVENRRFPVRPHFTAEDFRLKIEDCRFDPHFTAEDFRLFYRGRFSDD